MDLLSAAVAALVGGAVGVSWLAVSFVNVRTKQKCLYGSRREKITAYSLRISAVIVAYIVIVVGGRAMYVFTEVTLPDAVILTATYLGLIFLARRRRCSIEKSV